jgi:hypothetical protein
METINKFLSAVVNSKSLFRVKSKPLFGVESKSLVGVAIIGSVAGYCLYNIITGKVQQQTEPEPQMQDENSPLNNAFIEEEENDDLSTIPDDMTDVSLEHECYKNSLYDDIDPYEDACPGCWLTQPRTYNCECVNYSKSNCRGCDPYCLYCGGQITSMAEFKTLARRYIPSILRGITIGVITYFMYLDLQLTVRTITIGDTRYITNGATHIVIRTYNN